MVLLVLILCHLSEASSTSGRHGIVLVETAQTRHELSVESPVDEAGHMSGSDNSVIEDRRCTDQEPPVRRRERGGRSNRRWKPTRCAFPSPRAPRRSTILCSILQREHYSGDYIGDNIYLTQEGAEDIKLCSMNINKRLDQKLGDEIAGWLVAHEMDIAVIADPGIKRQRTEQVWVVDPDLPRPVPSLLLIGSKRIAMIFNKERWENRIIKHSVQYSPARRSMCVTIHLAKSRELWIVGTYIHHAPDQHVDEVHREWEWIEERVSDGRSRRGTVMVAGDFNTYSNEHLDRSAPGDMSGRARDMCRQFDAWTESLGITSTFRSRHPNTQRHTYCRNGTRTALDDIFVSSEHESAISASAIWLNSITTSDHVGVPVAILQCERGARVARNLNNVTPIKVVNTRTKTQDELDEFTLHTATMLDSGVIRLVDDIDVENSTQEQIQQWLERAIDNLYSCLYTSAKNLWGEVNQSKRHLARAVCIRRSNRCTSQLRLAKELLGIPEVTVETLQIAADAICWPKWVLHPDSMVEGSAHQNGARTINAMLTNIPLSNMYEEWIDWFEDIIKHWKSTIRIRRNWRQTSRRKLCQDRRRNWFVAGRTKAFLQTTLGKPLPPVSIRSAIIQEEGSARYTEDRSEVNRELTRLLDNWIPVDEQTTRPRYLDTALPEDAASLPDFAREWILPDIERGGRYVSAWSGAGKRWDDYHYTAEIQTTIDRKLKKHVAPGYGGISQEMWIASPAIVRHRERRVIELILRTGLAPKILLRKQMIFLPKTQTVDPTLDNSKGLLPWRPITVQSAFANRVFLVIKEFVDRGIPNSGLQHGFRNDRSVIDASLLTTLLLDRAKENRERLLLVSKDCLKCYDRIPSWVIELLYMGIGVPVMARKLMIDFLGSGNIDVRTAFGWLSTGEREFGIGQGSILAILHISVYMDCLQNQLATSVDPVSIRHHQAGHGIEVASTMFVDDQLDVSTTYEGLLDRARITNMFTGKDATGGVFGSAKSFQMYVTPDPEHFPAVMLNDGHSVPQPVRVVAPEEGFKHLGIQQGGEDQWATSLEPTWKTLVSDADRIRRLSLSLPEFRYVVNYIWIPRFRYRMLLGGAIKMAARVDVFIRQVARSVLKLPYYLPTAVYYDKGNGLGLESCEADANINRLVEALRILNTPELPVYHLLVERLEAYQIRAGLTDNPLCKPIAPPGTVTTWIAQVLRYAAALEPPLTMAIRWVQPRNARSERLNDRALMDLTPSEHHTTLLSINWKWDFKLRYVGDITSDMGTHILPFVTIMRSGKWDEKTRAKVEILYNLWRTALVIPTTNRLLIPVGCIPVDPRQTPAAVRIGVGHWIVAIRMNTEGPEPVIDQYELGYRDVGDAQMHQLGLTIPIRWWYERPRGSGIWFERTHIVLEHEFEAVCVPVTPTYLPDTATGRQRIILWTHTNVDGVRGANDEGILDEALARSKMRYFSVLHHGHTVEMATSCSVCHRHRDSIWCRRCGAWHHPQCVRGSCRILHTGNESLCHARNDALRFGWTDTTTTVHVSAGDGSVRAGNTQNATGTWAMQQPTGPVVKGQLAIHRSDITSTRCEVHALLAGLASSGDSGAQVCDNQSAIHIFMKARALATRTMHHIKYRDPHRIEIRSLSRLMQTESSMSPIWVKSHQEHLLADDQTLQQRRESLAVVDAAAGTAHDLPLANSYAGWIDFDDYMLYDEDGRLVFGNVAIYLKQRVYMDAHRKWVQKQHRRDETFHTVAEDELSMSVAGQWPPSLCRFYWRARTNVLHTNAVKNQFDNRWAPLCLNCDRHTPDTQNHRFGVAEAPCSDSTELTLMLRSFYDELSKTLLLPDQSLLIPAVGDEIAQAIGVQRRALWSDKGYRASLWCPMIRLTDDMWVNAQWLDWFGDPQGLLHNHAFASAVHEEQSATKRAPGGRLLPIRLVDVVRLIHPEIGLYEAYPGQWTPGWATVTFHGALNMADLDGLRRLTAPERVQCWWIDDLYVPRSGWWWERCPLLQPGHIYWVVSFTNSSGYARCTNLGCRWLVRIPAGQLQMRTDYSVVQTGTQPPFRSIYTKNTCAIAIGVVASTRSLHQVAAEARPVWEAYLYQHGSHEWLTQLSSPDDSRDTVSWRHPLFEWFTPEADTADFPVWWCRIRQQLNRLNLNVYSASIGWRRYPTMTPRSAKWAKAVSYTARGAKLLHERLFRGIWETLQQYWKSTCDRCDQAIRRRQRNSLRQDVNHGIASRRKKWAKQTKTRIAHILRKRNSSLLARSRRWHSARHHHLQNRNDSSDDG